MFHVEDASITFSSKEEHLLVISTPGITMSKDKGKENDRLSGMTRDDGALDVLLHAHRTKKTQASVIRECSKVFSDITNTPRLPREVKRKIQDVDELLKIQTTETEDALCKVSHVAAERSKMAHSEYVSNRLAREAKNGLVDDPTWQLPKSQAQAKLYDLIKNHATTLDENSPAASSLKRPLQSTTAAAKPPPPKKVRGQQSMVGCHLESLGNRTRSNLCCQNRRLDPSRLTPAKTCTTIRNDDEAASQHPNRP